MSAPKIEVSFVIDPRDLDDDQRDDSDHTGLSEKGFEDLRNRYEWPDDLEFTFTPGEDEGPDE